MMGHYFWRPVEILLEPGYLQAVRSAGVLPGQRDKKHKLFFKNVIFDWAQE